MKIKIDKFVVYNSDGQINSKRSRFDQLEKHAIDLLNLTQSLLNMANQKLQQSFVASSIGDQAETRGSGYSVPVENKNKKRIV